jgi:hypothetical protein
MKVNKEDRRCDDLPDDPDDRTKKNYGCNRVMLSEIGIYSIDDGPRFVELNENSRITIDGEGGDKDIKIHRNGQDVKITFKKERYPQCDSGVAGEHCGSNHVGKLLVDGAEIKNCDPEVKCEFWIRIKPRP